MEESIKILILEDSAPDADIIRRFLAKKNLNCEFNLAIDKETYLLALDQFHPDIILSDHSLPQFNSAEALAIARQRFPGIPFIMVTGTVSEEFAADIIKSGADDYILKDRLARLPVAITTVIQRRRSEKEKQDAEQKIKQSATHLRAIFENTSEGFLLMDKNAVIMAFNSKAEAYTFFSKSKRFEVGQSIYDFIEESRKEFFREIIARVLNGKTIQYDRSYEMKNGATAWIDFSATPVIEAGQVSGICIAGRDITEKKIIEQEREFDRNNLKALINNTNDLMWSVDRNFNLITSNEAFDKMVKVMSGRMVAKGSNVLATGFSNEQLNRFRKYYERTFSGQNFTVIEYADLPDIFWSEISFYPIYHENTVVGAACFSHDVTRQKKAEAQLKLSEEKYRTLFLKSPLPKWLYDSETLRFLDVNEAAIRHYGYSRDEFLKMNIKDIRSEEDIEYLLNDLKEIPEDQESRSGNFRHRKKNGEIITVNTTAHSIDYNNRKARMVIAIDITEKIKAEEDLRQSEIRLNEAQAIAHISNWEVDLARNIHTWSDESYRIYGLNRGEVQPSTEFFLSCMHPDDAGFAQKKVQEAFSSCRNSSFEFRFIRKDGVTRHGYTEWRFELDKKRNPVRLFGILQDITERKEAEENLKLLEQKIREQKIQEQKKIARAIIKAQEKERNHIGQELHDNINQILAGIKLHLSIEQKEERLQEFVKYPMELLNNAIDEIRLLSSTLVTPLKKINLKDLTQQLLDDVSKNTAIKTRFQYELPDRVIGEDLKLNIYRIIQEQLNNIVKHAAAKKLNISIHADNRFISVVVADDGKGFNVSQKRKGIGISNMINRTESFNGEVAIESSPGNGCKIEFRIPVN
jgi:PAS domain S-box-containing protein